MDECKRTVWDVLNSIVINVDIDERADCADRKYFEILNEGRKQNDITKIYEFIDAAERGGISSRNSEIITFFEEAYREDPSRLCRFIANKNSLYDYWVFLDIASNEMLLSFSTFEIENPLFFYECSRQIFKRFRTDNINITNIVSSIIKFANCDKMLWERWIKKQEYNEIWQAIVAKVLEQLNDEGLLIYADTISLDMPCHNNLLEIITDGFGSISSGKMEHVLKTISPRIIKRWETLVTEYKNNKKFINSTLICPYTNVILMCMNYSYSKKQILERIEHYIQIFVCEDEIWYTSVSDYISNINLNFTSIFYMLICKSEIVDILKGSENIKEYLELLQSLLNKYTKVLRSENEDFIKVLSLIEEVFGRPLKILCKSE